MFVAFSWSVNHQTTMHKPAIEKENFEDVYLKIKISIFCDFVCL